MNFEKYLDEIDEINLLAAFRESNPYPSDAQEDYLLDIMSMASIKSRQIAALALATAKRL